MLGRWVAVSLYHPFIAEYCSYSFSQTVIHCIRISRILQVHLAIVLEVAMQAYRVETTVQQDGTLILDNLPLQAGEAVEVIILIRSSGLSHTQYALRGTAIHYRDPTEPVALADWEAAV